jgi:hypothetical protein
MEILNSSNKKLVFNPKCKISETYIPPLFLPLPLPIHLQSSYQSKLAMAMAVADTSRHSAARARHPASGRLPKQ